MRRLLGTPESVHSRSIDIDYDQILGCEEEVFWSEVHRIETYPCASAFGLAWSRQRFLIVFSRCVWASAFLTVLVDSR